MPAANFYWVTGAFQIRDRFVRGLPERYVDPETNKPVTPLTANHPRVWPGYTGPLPVRVPGLHYLIDGEEIVDRNNRRVEVTVTRGNVELSVAKTWATGLVSQWRSSQRGPRIQSILGGQTIFVDTRDTEDFVNLLGLGIDACAELIAKILDPNYEISPTEFKDADNQRHANLTPVDVLSLLKGVARSINQNSVRPSWTLKESIASATNVEEIWDLLFDNGLVDVERPGR